MESNRKRNQDSSWTVALEEEEEEEEEVLWKSTDGSKDISPPLSGSKNKSSKKPA
jgi:hypothetical protein